MFSGCFLVNVAVEPFRPPLIADKVLHKLLKLDIVKHIKLKAKNDRPAYIYEIVCFDIVTYFLYDLFI